MIEKKFRVWYKLDKLMYNKAYITPFEVKVYIEGDGHYIGLNCDECEVMQYTGINDHTGREVYEGDLYEDEEHMLWEVIFNEFSGAYTLRNVFIPADMFVISLRDYEEFIYVGNIYENADLLKEY